MERKQKKGLAAAALAVLIVIAFLLLAGINSFTAPIIESNGASQQFEALLGVMPTPPALSSSTAGRTTR